MSIEMFAKETAEMNTTVRENKHTQIDFDKRVDVEKTQGNILENLKEFDPDKRIEVKGHEPFEGNGYSENKKSDSLEKQGGSYGEVHREGEGDKYEVHHMPADSASCLERNDGPAIKMEKADHRQTASCGCSKEAQEYRAAQKELIDHGKFREALQMDIDDIQSKFGDKYDNAISQMLEYVDKLEAEGKINE